MKIEKIKEIGSKVPKIVTLSCSICHEVPSCLYEGRVVKKCKTEPWKSREQASAHIGAFTGPQSVQHDVTPYALWTGLAVICTATAVRSERHALAMVKLHSSLGRHGSSGPCTESVRK